MEGEQWRRTGESFGGDRSRGAKQGEEEQKTELDGWVFFGENGNMEDERCNQRCVACQEYTVGKDSLKRGWEG